MINDVLEAFYEYAGREKKIRIKELTEAENLKEHSNRFIEKSIDRGFADSAGGDLDSLLPATSRRHGAREAKNRPCFKKSRKLWKSLREYNMSDLLKKIQCSRRFCSSITQWKPYGFSGFFL